MAQVDKVFVKNKKDITTYGLGSLISGGSGQGEENEASGFADMVDDFMRYSLKTRLGIPMLYAADCVHGSE